MVRNEGSKYDNRFVHWDGTVTAGNVLTAVAMMLALLAWGFRLESAVERSTDRIARLERERERDDRETAVLRDALSRMQADQAALLRAVHRIEQLLDRGRQP